MSILKNNMSSDWITKSLFFGAISNALSLLFKTIMRHAKGSLLIVSIILFLQNSYSQINSLNSKLNSLEINYDTAQLSEIIGNTMLLSEKNSQQALDYASKILAISNSNKDAKGIANSYNLLGNIYQKQSEYFKAKVSFEKSIEYSSNLENKKWVADAQNNLGTTCQKLGEYGRAIEEFLNAFDIYNELANKKGLATVCNNLGVLYYMLEQPNKSISFYNQAYLLLNELNDSINLKNTIANIGAVHFSQWQYDSAVYYFNKCYSIEQRFLDSLGMGKTLNSIGNVYLEQEKLTIALAHFNESLMFSKKVKDFTTVCSVYENIGLLNAKQDKLDLASQYYDSSYSIASKQNLIEQLKEIYLRLAELNEKKEDFREAYKYYQLYEEIKSSLLFERNLVTETEAVFLKQKQENKILRLEKEKEKKKNQVIMLISALIIILVFSGSILFIYKVTQKRILEKALAERQKQQFNAVLEAQEKERKRIAGDLHDSVGQILSIAKFNVSELVDFINEDRKEENELLKKSLELLDNACQEVRDISHNLMPGSLIRLGLVSATKDLIRNINSNNKINIHLNSEGIEKRFDEKIEFALYRILQETLNNAIKHSKSTEISISFNKASNNLRLIISDNGIGFNTSQINLSQGIGWKNIYSRLSIINGEIEVVSEMNKGTHITINIPV